MAAPLGSAVTFPFSGAGAVPSKAILPEIVPLPVPDPPAAAPAAGAPAAGAEVAAGAALSLLLPPPHAVRNGTTPAASRARVFRMDIRVSSSSRKVSVE